MTTFPNVTLHAEKALGVAGVISVNRASIDRSGDRTSISRRIGVLQVQGVCGGVPHHHHQTRQKFPSRLRKQLVLEPLVILDGNSTGCQRWPFRYHRRASSEVRRKRSRGAGRSDRDGRRINTRKGSKSLQGAYIERTETVSASQHQTTCFLLA